MMCNCRYRGFQIMDGGYGSERYLKNRSICHQCGHIWTNRVNVPHKCPRCQSVKWNEPSYRLVCYRCGHTWTSRFGNGSAEVRICPECKSKRWNEVIGLDICRSCGCRFVKSRNRRFCYRCSNEESFEVCCSFCGSRWLSPDEDWLVCPACGALHNKGRLSEDLELWSCGRTVLRYTPFPDVSVLYLWMDDIPISCRYVHEIASLVGISEDRLTSLSDDTYDRMWSAIASMMYNGRDDYKRDIPYYQSILDLSEQDAKILALHSTGMALEAIAIHLGTGQDDIRLSFDRIMVAYRNKGIVVDDTMYTDNPKTFY